jgi:di/tricarboxylate transporter
LIIAGISSAVINNTPVVVMFIPLLTAVAARRKLATPKIMMPLSFISILGGMTTLIGSSTNLLAAGIAIGYGVTIDFFAFTVPGIMMAGAGALYVIFVMPHILPSRVNEKGQEVQPRNLQFITEIRLYDGHPLIGEKTVAGMFPKFTKMTVRAVMRGYERYVPPFEDMELRTGDVLILAATRDQLTDALKEWRAFDNPRISEDQDGPTDHGIVLCEALVPPGSRLINNGIDQRGFLSQHGCLILGIERRSRMPRESLAEIRLDAGDVLLIAGRSSAINNLRGQQDVVVIEWSASEVRPHRFASRAQLIFAATVAAIATGIVPVVFAAIAGAFAMLAGGCLNVRQATRAIDRRIFLLVGSAIAMSTALETTGGASMIADWTAMALANVSPAMVMSLIFIIVAVLTNFLSNNATAVLFTPIAISTAQAIGIDPLPFVVAVILGANASFATPIGYQTNLLVMGPGHYRFKHFFIAGIPLIIIVWLVFSIVAPIYYGV